MKAITLHQPYASLIADGRKPFETRSWAPPQTLVDQRIAIHAGKRFDNELANAASRFGYTVEFGGTPNRPKPVATFPLGAVVCTAVLRGAFRVARLVLNDTRFHVDEAVPPLNVGYPPNAYNDWPGCRVDPYGDYSPGRWVWWLTDIKPYRPPVPARGRQGLWNWRGPELEDLI